MRCFWIWAIIATLCVTYCFHQYTEMLVSKYNSVGMENFAYAAEIQNSKRKGK